MFNVSRCMYVAMLYIRLDTMDLWIYRGGGIEKIGGYWVIESVILLLKCDEHSMETQVAIVLYIRNFFILSN